MNELTKTMGEIRSGLAEIRIPVLDTEALRKDMEAIASDRNKLSMEGLLRLEEKVTRMRHGGNNEAKNWEDYLMIFGQFCKKNEENCTPDWRRRWTAR